MCCVSGSINSTRIEPRPNENTSTTAIKSVIPQHGNILAPVLPVHKCCYKFHICWFWYLIPFLNVSTICVTVAD